MKTRFLAFLLTLILVCTIGLVHAEESDGLHFDRYYLVLPEMDLRADPATPGKVDTITAGQELELLYTEDIWAVFKYVKDGEEKIGCTWAGAVAPAIRIHLLDEEGEFIFHKPIYDRTQLGLISTWREPTDPDLLILWEETAEDGSEWLYVMCLDGRCGYMRREANFEIVE